MRRFTLINKKERWGFTWTGRFVVLIIFLSLVCLYALTIYPFLAQNDPVDAKIMVVEGFIPDYALEETIHLFNKRNDSLMIITGKVRIKGSQLDQYENDGYYSAATLIKYGFDENKIKVISLEKDIKKDRTYSSAVALKEWLRQNNTKVTAFNLVTISCHARRSKMMFSKAFDDEVKIGVIAIENQLYDPKRWWRSSSGFREVTEETITWIYGALFFIVG
jgi:uncharacterized SAM-binding protein YcdF (DUF218 family)